MPIVDGLVTLFQKDILAADADHKTSALLVTALCAHPQVAQQLLHQIPQLLSAADAALKDSSDTRLWQNLQPVLSFALLDHGSQGMILLHGTHGWYCIKWKTNYCLRYCCALTISACKNTKRCIFMVEMVAREAKVIMYCWVR